MSSAPKQGNGDLAANNNNSEVGKRKKNRGSKSSYLSKWLDKTMSVQNGAADNDFVPNMNWSHPSQFTPGSQFMPGYDPCRVMYGCTPEPMSLPTLPTYYSPVTVPQLPMYRADFHHYQNRAKLDLNYVQLRQRRRPRAEEVTSPAQLPSMNYLQPKTFTDSQDYTSLPPIVTSVADTNSNSEVIDKDESNNNNNEHSRRFSDPGLPDVAKNGDMESESESESDVSGSQVGSRLLTCFLDQITSLKAANERLNKDLIETRAELDSIRQHNMYLKGSSPSFSGTPNHSPLNSNGLVNGQYTPGFLTDLVREIRDAARVREEAMFTRVRAMLDRNGNDSSLASSEAKLTEKCLDEIKSSLRASEADKRCMMDRIAKLEEELRGLRTNGNGGELTLLTPRVNGTDDADTARLRKDLADVRKAKVHAEEHALKLERLVTQLRSKFNGMQLTNGPESLPSDPEHEPIRARHEPESSRIRRTSINSSSNSTVVFGPVTDL